MRPRLRFLFELLRDTGSKWSDVEGPRLGASFSFYATFSIFPLLLLAITVLGFTLGDDAGARARLLDAVASPDSSVRRLVEQTLATMQESRSARGLSFVVGLGTLLFGASGAFVELDAALNRIWEVPPRKEATVLQTVLGWLNDRAKGRAIVGGIGLTLLASLASSSVLGAIAAHAATRLTPALLQTSEVALSIVLLAAVFAATFHFVPRTRPPLRDVIGGAVLTTVLLTILKSVFASYLAHLTSYSAYGVAGSVLALATWIYLSSQIIFFGASLTRVHCEKTGCLGAPDRRGRSGPRARPTDASPTP